ncbi:MAG: TRAP transporter small permease [Hyphomicrobiaceae bacterium]
MDKLWNALCALSRVAVWCGGAMLFFAAFIVTLEVLLRKGLATLVGSSFTFSGSDEISGYLFAIGTSWSMAHVLVTRGHVRIDVLYGMLSARTRAWLDLVALLLLGIFVAAVVERAFDVSWTSLTEVIRSNTNLRIPLAWAQIPWLAGLVLFGLTIAVAFLRGAVALARGDLPAVAATIGIASQDEEIASELEGLGIAVHQDKDH